MERDDYFGVVYAAVGVGYAPQGYAQSEDAATGLARMRRYLAANPPPSLHHRLRLHWAATRLDGLVDPADRDRLIQMLRELQHDDGSWSLASLGDWVRRDALVIDPAAAPGDGYATGLATFVLRRIGLTAADDAVRRGTAWLKSNQRASGRWFTGSPNWDRGHLISNAGTAFALPALTDFEPVDTTGPLRNRK